MLPMSPSGPDFEKLPYGNLYGFSPPEAAKEPEADSFFDETKALDLSGLVFRVKVLWFEPLLNFAIAALPSL